MWIHMSICYLKSERRSASLSLWVLLCGGTINVGRQWKWTTTAGRDTVEWWEEWPRLRWHFYSIGGCDSGCPGRVTSGGGADSILRFQLERRGDRTKHYQKMKQKRWSRLDSMGRKCDTAWRRDRWSKCSELILALWKESVTRCDSVADEANATSSSWLYGKKV
jgi:hypothetical protein